MTSATPKPRAGEHSTDPMLNDLMLIKAERDLLRERERELVEFAKSVRDWYENAGNSDPDHKSPGSIGLWRAAKALLAKHGR